VRFKVFRQWRRALLIWQTETINAGFNIYRADGPYTRINDGLIPARGSAMQGALYSFVDSTAQNIKGYYYRLEDINLNGTSTFHGPVSATSLLSFGFRD